MALALYRKYRPGSFGELVGQEHVTGPLRTALASGRLHHAYLFSGPRGCGKTSSARILARSLNCAQGPTPDPCGVCDSCVALAPNGPGSLDVIEIDAASHGLVDDARDLRERAVFAPVSSRFKVYIIDEAHMITKDAFNALLKIVEEPPDFVVFVFATTEPDKVLGTIRSRTHHYPFRLMPRKELTALLTRVVEAEGVEVDSGAMSLVVRAAAGSARDGLSILDQVIASAGPEGVTREAAAGLLGVTPDTLLDDVVDAFAARDAAAVFAAVDQVMERGNDPQVFARDVLERLRDLVVLEAVPDAGERGLVDCPPEQVQRMARQATTMGRAALSRAADVFADGLVEMRGKTAPRLMLELVCARVLLPAASSDASALVERLERLERRLEIGAPAGAPPPVVPRHVPGPAHEEHPVRAAGHGGGPGAPGDGAAGAPSAAGGAPAPSVPAGGAAGPAASPAAPPAASPGRGPAAPGGGAAGAPSASGGAPAPSVPAGGAAGPAWPATATPGRPQPVSAPEPAAQAPAATAPAAPAGPGGLDAAAVRRAWDDVLLAVRSRSRPTQALLAQVAVADLSGGTLTIAFQHAPLMRQFQGRAGVEVLQESLREVLGADLQIACTTGPATHAPRSTGPGAAAPPPPVDDFAPGDEPEPVDPDAPAVHVPVERGDDAALRLVEQHLGGRVV
ncbi:MAG TPA: DNA polymerase III subunit gamma and tau, partial [Mycobacteriales bacterium]|nr:DNA polymerase III subunit gamma and tau [Mycobacteriales bacterium]